MAGLTGSLAWIWATSVADAFAWGAVRLAAFNLALASAPRTNRVVFIAMLGLATGLSGFLGGALAGPLLVVLQRLDVTVLSVRPSGYVWLFAVALVLRTQAWWWLRPVPDDAAGRPGLLRGMRRGLRGRRRRVLRG